MKELRRLWCALDGMELAGLDPRLYVQDIEERVKMDWRTAERPYGGRFWSAAPWRDTLEIAVTFMVKERDCGKRQQVLQRVNAWARAGWLTVSTRPDLRIFVICTQPAAGGSFAWSAEEQLVFAACGSARWQERYPVQAVLQGSDASAGIRPLGNRDCCLEAEVKNTSEGRIQRIRLTVNGRMMAFEGLGLDRKKKLRIYYDPQHVLHAEADDVSCLHCRTADSADDLLLSPGTENTVRLTADGPCEAVLYARGEYD